MPLRVDYEIGRQPCCMFTPEEGSMPGIDNEHSCVFCPLTVSFCLNCNADHHYRGWDLCNLLTENLVWKYALRDSKTAPCGGGE